MKKLPNLDALRFVLATLVLLYHLPNLCKNQGLPYYNELPIFMRGKEAVYMFFVLSGFLIIRLIYIEKEQGKFSIRKFYIRRILRIFPLYYFITAFGFVFYHLILPVLNIPFEINYNISQGLVLTLCFLPNVFAHLYKPGGILEVLWSIGIEEQFYLIIAPLLALIPTKRIVLVLTIITGVYFFIFHIEYFKVLKTYKFLYFFIFSGGIISLLDYKGYLEFLKSKPIIPLTIVTLTVLYFATDLLMFKTVWIQNLVSMTLFSLFVHTLAHNNYGVQVKSKLINYLGTISYGLYMFHIIALNMCVFVFLKLEFLQNLNNTITIILINSFTFVLTIILAHVSYTYYESYFLKLKQKFRV